MRVQRLPGKSRPNLTPASRTIDGFADKGVPDFGQVNPDLVGPASFQTAGEPGRRAAKFFDRFVMGDGTGSSSGRAGHAATAVASVGD